MQDEDDDELRRWAVETNCEMLQKTILQSSAEAAATYRWILGALVSLNAGGIALLASAHDLFGGQTLRCAIRWFFAGNVCAILAALVGTLGVIPVSSRAGSAMIEWRKVLRSPDKIDVADRKTKRALIIAMRWHGAAIFLGLLSLLALVIGVASAVDGIKDVTAPHIQERQGDT